MVGRRIVRLSVAVGVMGMSIAFGAAVPKDAAGQGLTYNHGQLVSPAFEGWRNSSDGGYILTFGYMNRNWEEQPDVPVGSQNGFSPGPADRGQPTHFLPRRNRFVFEVEVPADFGDSELVWTLTVHGEERKAFASLRQDYFLDNNVIMSETGTLGAGTSDPELRAHTAPVLELEMETVIDARVGQPVTLSALVTDDGLPKRGGTGVFGGARSLPINDDGTLNLQRAMNPPARITVEKVNGLHLTWFVYRGPANSEPSFSPIQIESWEDTRPYSNSPWSPSWIAPELPEDGRWITEVTFHEPGTYILQGRADDGGLFTDRQITIRVSRPVL